ncbi:PREDICTED: waprin-Thr1-like [Cyphomyrmex costatus]|uniref:waprin-Thr1-like n=1 Tax=Cyphomyrmex costatus TaxID=456900 RepID=UPI00085220B5|nr:PREDICTED: waprin-Thr1-like [Cyphomyrmex costatus]
MNRSLLLFAVLLVLLINDTSSQFYKTGNCPMRNTVTNCTPRCIGDGQCPSNEKCCPNKCGHTSGRLLQWSEVRRIRKMPI